MTKLTGSKKIKTAVFISGTGSNLINLIKFSHTKKSPIKIQLVISDNKNAKGMKHAKNFKIKKIDVICLAGFMKILSSNFIKRFKGKILNIHPSLLPKYKGLNTHNRAIENKENYSGCTVHYVNSKLDSGKTILQKKVKISKNDNHLTLKAKILKQEHILYPKALIKLFSNP